MQKCHEIEQNRGISIFLNIISCIDSTSLMYLFQIQHTLSSLGRERNELHNSFVKYMFLFCYVGLSLTSLRFSSLCTLLHYRVQTWSLPNYQTCFAQGNESGISFRLSLRQLQSLRYQSSHYQFISLFTHSMIEQYGTKAINVSQFSCII